MQFWQPCQKISHKNAKKILLFSKKSEKSFPQKEKSPLKVSMDTQKAVLSTMQ